VLREFRSRGTAYSCLILRGFDPGRDIDRSWRGVIGAIPKWDPLVILEEVQKHFTHGSSSSLIRSRWLARTPSEASGFLKPFAARLPEKRAGAPSDGLSRCLGDDDG
jgi:hypothetical protein